VLKTQRAFFATTRCLLRSIAYIFPAVYALCQEAPAARSFAGRYRCRGDGFVHRGRIDSASLGRGGAVGLGPQAKGLNSHLTFNAKSD
jgi:hypothetical protein